MRIVKFQCAFVMMIFLLSTATVRAADATSFSEAMVNGKVNLNIRYRGENVEQDNILDNATASTLRTVLGYTTGDYRGFSGYLEFEDVSVVGSDDYNSTVNGNIAFSVIPDPEVTELNQIYLAYKGEDFIVKSGRQSLILDNARFIGNVGWRQNEQTFDMPITYVNTAIDNLKITYGYMTAVQRIFGDDSPVGEFNMSNHILNAGYSSESFKLGVYGYFLEYDNPAAAALSQQTVGARFSGDGGGFSYVAELATQSDYADGAAVIDADYSLIELGYTFNPVTLKVGQEILGGDGVYAFTTPLATLHAFNGWADMFLLTPVTGLVDVYVDIGANVAGLNLKAVYHDFSADTGGIDFGTEVDLLIGKKFSPIYSGGIKFASFSSDIEPVYVDTDKVWIFFQANFAG